MENKQIVLEIQELIKLYPGVRALDGVNLTIEKGEVHALIGENGAGKSTLIKTVSGAIEPTSGKIILNGKSFDKLTPTTSRENGVAVVYQEFTLVPELTAAENIFLGEFPRKGWISDYKKMNDRAKALFESLNIQINPETKVSDLTTGYQQIVEIAKAVSKDANIVIMDEPSAPLTQNEVEAMFNIVRALKANNVAVIYISHRMEEIYQVADRVSILRDGAYVATLSVKETNKDELIRLMVGRTLKETYPERNFQKNDIVLSAKNLCGNGVKDISFDLYKGEILGFGGLVGAGRTELAALLFGSAKITAGELFIKEKKLLPKSPSESIAAGIALIPEDRKNQGLILEMSVKENLSLSVLKKLSKNTFLNQTKEKTCAQESIDALKIKTPGMDQKAKNLSGGNQQKIVIGKWLNNQPDILILDEPTRGIDVGAKQEIYKIMTEMVKNGKSIIMISSDMEELLGMSDRLVILCRGRYSATISKQEFSQELVLKKAAEVEK